MRLLFGMVLGAGLTVGTAFIYDQTSSSAAGTSGTTAEQRPMVNWDVVGRNLQELKNQMRDQWAKMSAR
jgi:hypothetical protein